MLQEQDLVCIPTEELELGETQPDETHQKEEGSEYLDQGQMKLAMEETKQLQEDIQLEDLGKQLDEQHHKRDVQQLEGLNIKETWAEVQSTKLKKNKTKLGELEVLAETAEEDKQIADEHDILQLKKLEL